MNKKRVMIIILVVLLMLQQCIYMAKDNYQLGNDLHRASQKMAHRCFMLTDSIACLQEKFDSGDVDDLNHTRRSFDQALSSCWSWFGDNEMPLRNEVLSDYSGRIMDIFHLCVNDSDNKRLIKLFTDEKKSRELSNLKEQLELMTETLTDFCDRYDEIPIWKRYFVSWRREREALTEKLRIPE